MATEHEWPPRSGFVLSPIVRGWGHTYYWPVDLPPLYKDCSLYPLAWCHFIGVNDALLPSGEIDPAKWGAHIRQRAEHVAYTLRHPQQCHGGFGLGMYTSYALQDPRSTWSLASVHIESRLVGEALRTAGASTATLRAWLGRGGERPQTVVCRGGSAPPVGCNASSYLAGSGACGHSVCYLDPCFSCVRVATVSDDRAADCAARHSQASCAASSGCSWQRAAAVDCWP